MYSTEGIILKKIGAGEADALYIIYTKDFGKIRALARGVKKEGAKLKGHLELLSLSSLSFVFGKNGEQLTQAALLNSWPVIRQDWARLRVATQLVAMVDRGCLEGDKDEALWKLLLESIIFLEKNDLNKKNLDLFREEFVGRLSACLGYGNNPEDLKRANPDILV